MNWYVLFVRAGEEQNVERLLKIWLDTDIIMPFIPLNERLFKNSGIIKKELKPLFPGYVFIESELKSHEFIRIISPLIHASSNIIRLLRYSDSEFSVRETEKQMLLRLYNEDYCIESSSGIMIGDRIYITEGPLIGCESIVKKLNRHKREAWVELDFMGDKRLINVSLQIVQRLKEEREVNCYS